MNDPISGDLICFTPGPTECWLGACSALAMLNSLQSWPRPSKIDESGLRRFTHWSVRYWREQAKRWDKCNGNRSYGGYGFSSWNIGKFSNKFPLAMALNASYLTVEAATNCQGKDGARDWHRLQIISCDARWTIPLPAPTNQESAPAGRPHQIRIYPGLEANVASG